MLILVRLLRLLPLLFLSFQTCCVNALAKQTKSTIYFQGTLKQHSLNEFFGNRQGTDLGEKMLLTSEFGFGLSIDIASSGRSITKLPAVAKDIYIDVGQVYEDPSHEGAAVLLVPSGEVVAAAIFTRPCRSYGSNVTYFNCSLPHLKIFLRDRSKFSFVKNVFQNWARQFLLAQNTNRDWLSFSIEGSLDWGREQVTNPVNTSIVFLDAR